MEVLHYELVDASTPLWVPLFLIGVALIFAIGMGIELGVKHGVTFIVLCVTITIVVYLLEDELYYEHTKAKVTDWNIVHNEGWEVVKQEGEIVELKRELGNQNGTNQ